MVDAAVNALSWFTIVDACINDQASLLGLTPDTLTGGFAMAEV